MTGPIVAEGALVRLDLPYKRPPAALVGNSRAHWRRRSADTKQVRADVLRLAQAAGLHRLDRPVEHVTVTLTWAPGDRRRRDADNLWPLLKACCDALARGRQDWVGLDLVPDDTPTWMEKRAPRIEPPPTAAGMWLDVGLRFRLDPLSASVSPAADARRTVHPRAADRPPTARQGART
ncbi:hypothetical protein I4I73_03390 [Pseudonocardia sp. KRD-184]|uniref:Uncharacterized protein n=1 Tax=Pseudonocardia oceani TaxID=2792013 RepID=A0ABS6UK44_9PSEU|nr:hypothetical protein [Pseudonocardia oceani]MBW0088259.1 hypothetical protein [Pseudonocardia oceani]MBW0095041.1 hypothetical protein [Pseudonocardia oceani]MBW0121106.1 hypothetical protein [Pseudonocardia oceani]MBW0131208.1 hypothetical protein [Pseudonocardia oceani]MBW0132625.1 hypothetical protein [Pseudonocardia oceani]